MKGFLGGVSLGAIACVFGVSTLGLIVGPPTPPRDTPATSQSEPDAESGLPETSEPKPEPVAEPQPVEDVAELGVEPDSDVAADVLTGDSDIAFGASDTTPGKDLLPDLGAIEAPLPVVDPPELVSPSDYPDAPDADMGLPAQPQLAPVDALDDAVPPEMPGRLPDDQGLTDGVQITSQLDAPVRPADQDVPDLVALDQHDTAPVAPADPEPSAVATPNAPSVVFRPRTGDSVDPSADSLTAEPPEDGADQAIPPLQRYAAQHSAREFAPRMALYPCGSHDRR